MRDSPDAGPETEALVSHQVATTTDFDVITDLRQQLDEWCNADGTVVANRENVRRLLGLVISAFASSFRWQIQIDDVDFYGDHWALDLLVSLDNALADLDQGLVPPLVRAVGGGNGSKRRRHEQIRDDGILELVEVVRHGVLHGSNETAEGRVAARLKATGTKRRQPIQLDQDAKAYDDEYLKNLKKNKAKRKP